MSQSISLRESYTHVTNHERNLLQPSNSHATQRRLPLLQPQIETCVQSSPRPQSNANCPQLDAIIQVAAKLQAEGKYEDSIILYNTAIELDPLCVQAYFNKGLCLQKCGQHSLAIECYDRVIQLQPQHFSAYYNKGKTL